MASYSIGALNIKIVNLNFARVRAGKLQQPPYSLRTWTGQRHLQNAARLTSQCQEKTLTVCSGTSSKTETALKLSDECEEAKPSELISQLIPTSFEVESLITDICDTTSIAEFELKLGGFHLYMIRDLTEKVTTPPPPPPSAAPASIDTTAQAPVTETPISTTSLAISKLGSSSGTIQNLLDKATDEGLAILHSPRVGYFRRARTIKGKRAPPPCKENQLVKEGQVLCYIEQLGGELPIESDISGEVIKILRKDGDPVGYGDALMAILPSFPGIKKLQ